MKWFAKTFKKSYQLGDKLGEGSFAEVRIATHKKSDEQFACKIMHLDSLPEGTEKVIQREVDIMKNIQHENCVSYKDYYQESRKIFIVMELVTGGELFDEIVQRGTFSEADARDVIVQLARALEYIHKQGIVHRDIKPENLLIAKDKKTIKLSDFGLAQNVRSDEELMSTMCGTPGYVAPEILRREDYGVEVDIWSLGVVLYILLCGFPPFYNDDTSLLFRSICTKPVEFPSPYWDSVSDEAKDLVQRTLQKLPEERITIAEILEHPWILQESADAKANPMFLEQMRRFNAKRKMKRAFLGVMATTRLQTSLRALSVAKNAAENAGNAGNAENAANAEGGDEPAPAQENVDHSTGNEADESESKE